MKIESVFSESFAPYGRVAEGYDLSELFAAMNRFPIPQDGTTYEPGVKELEECRVFTELSDRAYGGMPIQIGLCAGHNKALNCLEYHRDSEFDVSTEDMVLLLAKQEEIVNGKIDSSRVKAFMVPAGVMIECYATTLHYAPCHVNANGFNMAVILPRGTNTDKPAITPASCDDERLFARNKWLLAHPSAPEAATAYIGITGENIVLPD